MKVVIFGGTGATGRNLVEQALAAGHDVTLLARDPARVAQKSPRLRVLQGDARDAAAVDSAVAGQEVVISALGPSTGANKAGSEDICSASTPPILAAMKKHGVRRFLCVSSVGVGDSRDHAGFVMRLFFDLVIKKPLADKAVQEELIRKSDVDWIIIRPTGLHDGQARGRFKVAVGGPVPSRISRADVAAFTLAQLSSDQYLRQAPSIGG